MQNDTYRVHCNAHSPFTSLQIAPIEKGGVTIAYSETRGKGKPVSLSPDQVDHLIGRLERGIPSTGLSIGGEDEGSRFDFKPESGYVSFKYGYAGSIDGAPLSCTVSMTCKHEAFTELEQGLKLARERYRETMPAQFSL